MSNNTTMPILGSHGKYTFKGKYSSYNRLQLVFSCQQLSKLSELTSSDIDPRVKVYEKYDILDDYDYHVELDMTIVTLKASSGITIMVPLPYIESSPLTNGVAYAGTSMVVNLGIVPRAQKLDVLEEGLQNTAKEILGVKADVSVVIYTPTHIVDIPRHDVLQNLRNAKIDQKQDLLNIIEELKIEKDLLSQKLAELEAYILSRP